MEWFVVQAYSGYEQKVKAAMEERIMLANLKEKFGEILVPVSYTHLTLPTIYSV